MERYSGLVLSPTSTLHTLPFVVSFFPQAISECVSQLQAPIATSFPTRLNPQTKKKKTNQPLN